MRRYLKAAAITLSVLVVSAWAAPSVMMVSLQRTMIFQNAVSERLFGEPVAPEGSRLVTYATSDGETISAIWKSPTPGGKVLITFHGNAGSPMQPAARFLRPPWAEHGWGFLAPVLRGYPGSTGTPSESGMIFDAEAAYRFVRDNAPDAAIVAHGHSLGAASAVMIAADHDLAGIYLEAPFTSVAEIAYARAWWMPRFTIDAALRDPLRSDLRMKKVVEPAFVVHGDLDRRIPPEASEELATASGGPVTRVVVGGGTHSSIVGSRDVEAERMFQDR